MQIILHFNLRSKKISESVIRPVSSSSPISPRCLSQCPAHQRCSTNFSPLHQRSSNTGWQFAITMAYSQPQPAFGKRGAPRLCLQRVILLCLLLQQPRLAVLGNVRLVRLRSFTCSSTEFFLRKMKSKFTWLFMAQKTFAESGITSSKTKKKRDEGREGGQLVQVSPALTMADGNFAQTHGWNYSPLILECERSWITTTTQSHQIGSNNFPIPILKT